MKKAVAAGILCCALLTACGQKSDPEVTAEDRKTGSDIQIELESADSSKSLAEESGSDSSESSPDSAEGGDTDERLIRDQTFDVDLNPLGEITFVSYAPDTRENPLADVEFALVRAGKEIAVLEGVYEDNIRTNEVFQQVEAVSFKDYNSDGFQDIIVICSYSPSSGPDVGAGYSETRIYRGTAEGVFVYERGLSGVTTEALAIQTIQSVLGFLGVDRKPAAAEQTWQQAYMDYLAAQEPEQWSGFSLIWLNDDDIPELVAIGRDEASGCVIINYDANAGICETQLNRLGFSYIERGNLLCNSDGHMDTYYDLVYSLKDNRLTLISEGYFGAEDNTKLEFDGEGNPIYQYEWDGVKMTEEEYNAALNRVYDITKAKPGYEWGEWKTAAELTEELKKQ